MLPKMNNQIITNGSLNDSSLDLDKSEKFENFAKGQMEQINLVLKRQIDMFENDRKQSQKDTDKY